MQHTHLIRANYVHAKYQVKQEEFLKHKHRKIKIVINSDSSDNHSIYGNHIVRIVAVEAANTPNQL